MKMRTSGPRPVVEGDQQKRLRAASRAQCERQSWQRLWARWQQLLYQQPLLQAAFAQEPRVVLQLFQLMQLLQLMQLPRRLRTFHMQVRVWD